MPPSLSRVLAATALAGLVLAGCGGGETEADPAPTAAPTTTAPPAPQLPEPEPEVDPDVVDRSPEALAAQVEFVVEPEVTDPLLLEGLADYEEALRQLMVAQGLSEPDYPPLVALIDPSFQERALAITRANRDAGVFLLGDYTETVVAVAGNQDGIFMQTCSDYRERDLYSEATQELDRESDVGNAPFNVSLIRNGDRWTLLNYVGDEGRACP